MSGRHTICIAMGVILAILFAAFSIGVSIAAMAHNQWIFNSVSQPIVSADPNLLQSYSSWRGMFVECPNDINSPIFINSSSQRVSPGCFPLDFGKYSQGDLNYWNLIALRRSHVGTFVSGLFSTTVGIFVLFGAVCAWCCSSETSSAFRKVIFFTGFLCIIGGLCYIVSMLVFHICLDEEKSQSTSLLPFAFAQWSAATVRSTDTTYNVGYGLGWAACISTLLGGMLMWMTYCCIASYEESLLEGAPMVIDNGQDNPAFQNSNYILVKDSTNFTPSPYHYQGYSDINYDDPGAQRLPVYPAHSIRAPDQESHYSNKNIYRIY